jgi:ectoine hydroxylase-related dioxygenase (phytanoyl-CoA dioxygenase family)
MRTTTEPWWSSVLDAQGAVVIAGALDAPAIASVRARVDSLVERARPILASGGVKQVLLDEGITVDPTGGTTYITGLEHDPDALAAVNTRVICDAVSHCLRRPGRLVHLRYRSPKPGAGAQTLHRDAPGVLADGTWQSVTVIVTLCEFTETNGSLRVVPSSHREHPDGFVARAPSGRHPRERVLSAPPGSALVFSAGMLHSGTTNTSDAPRPGLQALFA